ncbi:MAG: M20/M25/M40 family metallo-hydrolase [Limisphaerales bacterium]
MNSPARLVALLPLALWILIHASDWTAAAQSPTTNATATPGVSAPRTNSPIERIRDEGLNRSQVMTTLSYLTDVIGPRLTGSPELRRANEWTRDRFTAWGLTNAQAEPWGQFGRGWSLKRFSAQVIAPQSIPLIAYPKAWSPSVGPQPVTAEVVHVDIKKPEDFAQFRGKLRGKVVLDGPLQDLKMRFEPLAVRRNETNLLALANATEGVPFSFRPTPTNFLSTPEQRAAIALTPRRYQFYAEEGVAVLLQASRAGEAGTLFTQGATVYEPRRTNSTDAAAAKTPAPSTSPSSARSFSPWSTNCPPITPQVTVAAEHYNRLVRMIALGEKLRVAVELQADYHTQDLSAANTVAEIPGTDLAEELVMLGAHLDSWQSGTGTTDNATGCAVVMEAVRILQTLGLKPRRTIRVALWTGEEQGLLGSKAYVTKHFGSTVTSTNSAPASGKSGPSRPVTTIAKKPAYDNLSAYFNLDNGTGKIRGIYLQNNEAARTLFRQWLVPFRDLGAETVTYASTSATDHVPFDAIGLPGFQFIQDDIEYWTRTHHANMDVFDRAVADDLKQASVIMAAFVYQAAMRDEKIPRKPAPGASAAPSAPAAKSSVVPAP